MAEVSVIVAVFKSERTIARTLESLINQTFHDIDIVIINNASTDNSVNIIRKYQSKDSRIKMFTEKVNIGSAGAYQRGIEHSDSKYFTFCDSDDYVEPEYIEAMYKKAEETGAEIVLCGNDMISEGMVQRRKYDCPEEIVLHGKDIRALLPQIVDMEHKHGFRYLVPEIGAAWAKLYLSDYVKEQQVQYDKSYGLFCDWIFNFELFKNLSSFAILMKPLYHYVQNPYSVVHEKSFDPMVKTLRFKTMDKIFQLIDQECCHESSYHLTEAKKIFAFRCINGLYQFYFDSLGESTGKNDVKKLREELKQYGWYEMYCKIPDQMSVSLKERMKYYLFFYEQTWIYRILKTGNKYRKKFSTVK